MKDAQWAKTNENIIFRFLRFLVFEIWSISVFNIRSEQWPKDFCEPDLETLPCPNKGYVDLPPPPPSHSEVAKHFIHTFQMQRILSITFFLAKIIEIFYLFIIHLAKTNHHLERCVMF